MKKTPSNRLSFLTPTDFINRTFRMTADSVRALEELTIRLSREANIDISMGKVLGLIILNARTKSISELLNIK
jgi:hypothetical protein